MEARVVIEHLDRMQFALVNAAAGMTHDDLAGRHTGDFLVAVLNNICDGFNDRPGLG
ncbi:MAG: hypothetical protein JXQ75_04600 [Phycisphaerae bacterium]|nr:hypothetical protein [Phycisphaerae bacterium]